LGLDLDGTLEVSNCFPLPHHAGDEDEKSAKLAGPLMILQSVDIMFSTGCFFQHGIKDPCCVL
jgi:hypothetical protein